MQCRSCGTPILATFKHAMAQNECPACGGQIMDEESLALIEDIENTIRGEATVREETAHHLAVILVARYDIALRHPDQVSQSMVQRAPTAGPKPASRKIAPPSAMKQAMRQTAPDVVAPDVPDGITDRERDQIFEQAVRDKYNIVDQVQGDVMTNDVFDDDESQAMVPAEDSVFSEGAAQPVLERERMARLAKQQQAMNGGGQGVFRRSS